MPSAANSTRAPGHRRRSGAPSGNGPSANASPRSSTAPCDASLINANRFAAAPLRFPFTRSSPSTFTCTKMVWGSSSSTVTTHGPMAMGRPSAVSTGDPSTDHALQSLTSV